MVIKYTRVSGKKQFDTSRSIENQNRTINEFAQKTKFKIVILHLRYPKVPKLMMKRVPAMIEFCKPVKGKIITILVYKMTRFSHYGRQAISIADELLYKVWHSYMCSI